jgi:hypothetical protein
MNVFRGLSGRISRRGKRMEVHVIYAYGDRVMEPTKHCLKKERRMGTEWRG